MEKNAVASACEEEAYFRLMDCMYVIHTDTGEHKSELEETQTQTGLGPSIVQPTHTNNMSEE